MTTSKFHEKEKVVEPEAPKSKYLVIVLPPHVDEANAALAKASEDGYTKVEQVYVVTSPSSASTAFALMSA